MLRKLLVAVATVTVALTVLVGLAIADPSGSTGQPNQSCQNPATSTTPGNAASAPGSPFNESGVSGGKYAGNQPQNSNNPNSVSQYDVACAQVSQH